MTTTPHRRALPVVIAVITVQLIVFIVVWRDARDAQIRYAPVGVAAPAIVADSLARESDSLPGHPFDSRVLTTSAEARSEVRDGSLVAALVVDLSSTSDTLYVGGANGSTLVKAVTDRVRAVEESHGRAATVTDLVPARSHDKDQYFVRLLVLIWTVIGFAVAAGIAVAKGAQAPTRATSVVRLAGLGGVAVVAGLIGAIVAASSYDGHLLPVWLLGTLSVFAAGATTMACQSLFGLAGIGIATVVFLMLAVPDYIATHTLLLPQPWPTVDPWVPHSAATSALVSIVYFGGSAALRPLLVLVAWSVLSIGVMALSRHERALATVGVA